MSMSVFLVFAFLFFIGSCIGWGLEVLFRSFFSKNNPEKKWMNPGFLVGTYLPLYGFGLVGMYVVSYMSSMAMTGSKIADTIIILVVMTVVMTIIEYIAGLIFIKGMNVKLWDYSEEKFNLQGIICPKFSVAWGILGCIYYFLINPYVIDWVRWLSHHLSFSFFVGLFFGVFIVDVCYSIHLSAKIRSFAKEKEIVVKYDELKETIRKQREELKEKKRFILAFRSEKPLRSHLEKYLEERFGDQFANQFGNQLEELKSKSISKPRIPRP